jgi:hypothetical protein
MKKMGRSEILACPHKWPRPPSVLRHARKQIIQVRATILLASFLVVIGGVFTLARAQQHPYEGVPGIVSSKPDNDATAPVDGESYVGKWKMELPDREPEDLRVVVLWDGRQLTGNIGRPGRGEFRLSPSADGGFSGQVRAANGTPHPLILQLSSDGRQLQIRIVQKGQQMDVVAYREGRSATRPPERTPPPKTPPDRRSPEETAADTDRKSREFVEEMKRRTEATKTPPPTATKPPPATAPWTVVCKVPDTVDVPALVRRGLGMLAVFDQLDPMARNAAIRLKAGEFTAHGMELVAEHPWREVAQPIRRRVYSSMRLSFSIDGRTLQRYHEIQKAEFGQTTTESEIMFEGFVLYDQSPLGLEYRALPSSRIVIWNTGGEFVPKLHADCRVYLYLR